MNTGNNRKRCLLLWWLLGASGLPGQEGPAAPGAGKPSIARDDIAVNLARSEEEEGTLFFPSLDRLKRGREYLRGKTALEWGLTYHTLFLADLIGDGMPAAGGGDLTLQGLWNPMGRWLEHPTDLRFRVRYRHAIGDLAPGALGEEIGALWGVVDGFSDSGLEVPDFYFRKKFRFLDSEVRYGQMAVDAQLDSHELGGSKQSFLSQAFSSNPAVAFPRFGAGLTVAGSLRERLRLVLAASTIQGTRQGEQVDFKWDSGAIFSALQASYEFEGPAGRRSRIQVMGWHSDQVPEVDQPEGQGVSLTGEREMDDDGTRGFARLAWSDGGAAPLDLLLSAGVARRTGSGKYWGFGAGAGRGSGEGRPLQGVVESFWRWRVRKGVRITPDVQLIFGEGLREGPGFRIVAGLRGEIDF